MTRQNAIGRAAEYYASGAFRADLVRRVALHTESQKKNSCDELRSYFSDELIPTVAAMGFASTVVDNPVSGHGPFLIAERHEADDLPTVLIYGHGDVVRGQEADWSAGLDPWTITIEGDRWYGRGTADNKGQHSVNLGALAEVITVRGGRLGFNTKLLFEMGEEIGSPGMRAVAEAYKDKLAADLLIASDGPRLSADRPTVFLGSRGFINFDLTVKLRDGGHHSGHWGGLLANAGTILANAIASMVDGRGRLLVEALRPESIPNPVKAALADIRVGGGPGDPDIDAGWGEPGLTLEERVFAWNTMEVLAFETGNPRAPVGAIPPAARATMQLRFVVGTKGEDVVAAVRRHLDDHGFSCVAVTQSMTSEPISASRLDPADPWVSWTLASIQATTGKSPALLPNLGGSLPNDVFSEVLELPTIWIPHSYPACSQHAPNEHLLGSIAEEGLRMMAGIFWDLGETGAAVVEARRRISR